MTREEKIEQLVKMEWEDFQKVQNEGGRASCQDDPETFFIMRRSQFFPWTEELIDSYIADLTAAREEGRNLLAEKYGWMMEHTAPERFRAIRHLLKGPSLVGEQLIDEIVDIQIPWMRDYRNLYPVLGAGNRALYAKEDTPFETSFETYLRGELHTYSDLTLRRYLNFLGQLKKSKKNLTLMIMEEEVRAYGYKGLDDAEKKMAGRERSRTEREEK